jgi:hypothetical protein
MALFYVLQPLGSGESGGKHRPAESFKLHLPASLDAGTLKRQIESANPRK